MIIILIVVFICLPIIIGVLAILFSDMFIAPREHYVNSPFDMLKKRLNLGVRAAAQMLFIIIVIIYLISIRK